MEAPELIYSNQISNLSNENKILKQKNKTISNEVLSKKTELIQYKDQISMKIQILEEERASLRAKDTVNNDKINFITQEKEKMETAFRCEIQNLKNELDEQKSQMQNCKVVSDQNFFNIKEEAIKKEMEFKKAAALNLQQIQFYQAKNEELKAILESKEAEIAQINEQLKVYNIKIQELEGVIKEKNQSFSSSKKEKLINSESLDYENQFLKKQLEQMQEQVSENKKLYEKLMVSLGTNN